jgi:hypothetical protein
MTSGGLDPAAASQDTMSAKARETPSILQPSASYSITMRVR